MPFTYAAKAMRAKIAHKTVIYCFNCACSCSGATLAEITTVVAHQRNVCDPAAFHLVDVAHACAATARIVGIHAAYTSTCLLEFATPFSF
jgi:hypothetical protein